MGGFAEISPTNVRYGGTADPEDFHLNYGWTNVSGIPLTDSPFRLHGRALAGGRADGEDPAG